jgi:hypothetical protein
LYRINYNPDIAQHTTSQLLLPVVATRGGDAELLLQNKSHTPPQSTVYALAENESGKMFDRWFECSARLAKAASSLPGVLCLSLAEKTTGTQFYEKTTCLGLCTGTNSCKPAALPVVPRTLLHCGLPRVAPAMKFDITALVGNRCLAAMLRCFKMPV